MPAALGGSPEQHGAKRRWLDEASALVEQLLLAVDRLDPRRVLLVEFQLTGREVRLQVCVAARLRDRHDVLEPSEPREAHRRGRGAVFLGDIAELGDVEDLALGERRVGDQRVAGLVGVLSKLTLAAEGMHLDLMGGDR